MREDGPVAKLATDAARRPRSPLLHPDRYFDANPAVRDATRALYEETRDLPIVSPHGHVDPRLLAENEPFPEPTALLLIPDHYIFRMLYSRGIPLERLGIPARDGTPVEEDPRTIWRLFAEHYFLFRGTPTGAWLDHELHELFGVSVPLSAGTADRVYDEISEKLQSPEFRPRALFERFRIEVLATTDAATDPLEHHNEIRESDWDGRVIPTFRPDALFRIAHAGWRGEAEALARASGVEIRSYETFLEAIRNRREFFRRMGATATDHGVEEPFTVELPPKEREALFARALAGDATPEDQRRFEAQMLMEMARMSCEDGLVMQLHAGSLRDHNRAVFERFGTDKGGDIPVRTEWTRNLRPLLNAYGNDPRLTLVLFTLDESTYARELAPLAGHYPAVKLGPAWWFHDSIEGMTRYRQQTTET
ncbi:MAG: glucuronate isomerase, partial [Gemmatimonadetes bacterium]|nr:glucuronate isomerase [Gemmatimonadota bacterium]